MLDASRDPGTCQAEVAVALPRAQRVRGRAGVSLHRGGLRNLAQSGSAKAFLPRAHGPAPEVVFLNTAGGLTGGDALAFSVTLEDGADAIATTQTAERIYASSGGAAAVDVELSLAEGARLDWLPQETILYNHSALRRRTKANLARGASLLMVETVVLGRAAMGEQVTDLDFRDHRVVRREGVPVWLDPFALGPDTLADRPALTRGNRALATLAFIADGAENALGPVREVLTATDVQAHASAWDGRLVLRAAAPDGLPMRRLLAQVLTTLRRRPLPRVWQI